MKPTRALQAMIAAMAGARGAGRDAGKGAGPGGAGASVGSAAANALYGSLHARPAGAGGGHGSGAAAPPVRLLHSKLGGPLTRSRDHTHSAAACGDAVADSIALMRACGAATKQLEGWSSHGAGRAHTPWHSTYS